MVTFVMRKGRNGKFRAVRKERAEPLPGAFVISDEMAPLRHMANGKMYDSKSRFRAATIAAGCREVGNDTAHMFKPRQVKEFGRGYRREVVREQIRRQLHGEPPLERR